MTAAEDDDGEAPIELVMELITASFGDEAEFFNYVARRLSEERLTGLRAVELIVLLATFAGNAVSQWAEDTDRPTSEVLHAIGMNFAEDESP